MTSVSQRSARAAFDAARAAFDRLSMARSPDDTAAALMEAWDGSEKALQALAGTSALGGLALVRELRQRELLSLDQAHATVDFHAAIERVRNGGYAPTPSDIATAQLVVSLLPDAFSLEAAAPVNAVPPASGPISAPPVSRSPAQGDPPLAYVPSQHKSGNRLAFIVVGLAVLAVVAAGVYYALLMRGGSSSDLARGRSAYAAGDRITARNAFSAAAGATPALAEPHVFLGRIAREEGDMATAKAELTRAVELEPGSAVAQRELAALLLATGQLELARSFYERAIRLDPTDRNALGFMGCTLLRQGRPDVAQRFLERAGPGSWQSCAQIPNVPPPPVPR